MSNLVDLENPTLTTPPNEASSLTATANFFRSWVKTRDEEILSENRQKLCSLVLLSCVGILLFVLIFGLLPMPLGYVVYIVIYPGSDLMMFSIFTWGVGFLSMSALFFGCGSYCCCIYFCCLA
jgi:hypothetical protein